MAGPWERYGAVQPSAPIVQGAPWQRFTAPQPQPEPQPETVASGAILPISRDSEGNVHFDSNAGVLGVMKRAFTLPHDVMTGQVPVYDESGHTSPQMIGRSLEAATVMSPVNPAVRMGERAIPGEVLAAKRPKVPVPTAEELKAAGAQGYDAVRGMDVRFAPEAIDQMARSIQDDLVKEGFISENAPVTNSVISRLRAGPEGGFATPGTLDVARQALGKVQPGTPDYAAAQRAIRGLDGFVMEPPAEGVVAGPAAAAADALKTARGNYAAGKRSDKLQGVEYASGLRSDAANSGLNSDNSIRSRIASLLLNDKQSRGFNAAEETALESIVRGDFKRNSLRRIANLLGGGGGLGGVVAGSAGAGAGLAAGSPTLAAAGAMAPVVGYAAKLGQNKLAERALTKMDEMTRKRSPLHEERLANTPYYQISPEKRAFIVRMLLADPANQAPQR